MQLNKLLLFFYSAEKYLKDKQKNHLNFCNCDLDSRSNDRTSPDPNRRPDRRRTYMLCTHSLHRNVIKNKCIYTI